MSSLKIEKKLNINGMSCQKCVKRVHKILSKDPSIENIHVDLETGSANFQCQADTDISALLTALKEYDFNASE
ncbi:MAG: heavy-metal-associated domain-containing protein [Gammaproteobacteria bacterium]|nr:heavy-metal-associated domain-containing protein [Gammaproteobacteria bacterium]